MISTTLVAGLVAASWAGAAAAVASSTNVSGLAILTPVAVLASAASVWGMGVFAAADGRFIPALLGALTGGALAFIGGAIVESSVSDRFGRALISGLLYGLLPLAGAITGYELSVLARVRVGGAPMLGGGAQVVVGGQW